MMTAFPYLLWLAGFIVTSILLVPSYQLVLVALNTSVMERAPQFDLGLGQRELARLTIAPVRPTGAIIPKL